MSRGTRSSGNTHSSPDDENVMPCCRKLRARAAPRSSRSLLDSSCERLVQRLGVRVRRAVGVDHLVVGVAAIVGEKPIHDARSYPARVTAAFRNAPETLVRPRWCDARGAVRSGWVASSSTTRASRRAAVFQVQPHEEGPAIVRRLEWHIDPDAPRHGVPRRVRQRVPAGHAARRPFDAALRRPGRGARRDRGGRPRRRRDPGRRAARRRAAVHAPQPLRPPRRARRRGVAAVRRRGSRLPAGRRRSATTSTDT